MPTQQGSLALLDDPVAQHLLHSSIPARLGYTWKDGTPRVIPINFHWNGRELVFGSFPDGPKFEVLKDGSKVTLTIDTDTMPYKVLTIRGSVRTDTVEGIAPEYELLTIKVMGEEQGRGWLAYMSTFCPQMTRIFVTPEWVSVVDFETRFPGVVERAMERAQAGAQGG